MGAGAFLAAARQIRRGCLTLASRTSGPMEVGLARNSRLRCRDLPSQRGVESIGGVEEVRLHLGELHLPADTRGQRLELRLRPPAPDLRLGLVEVLRTAVLEERPSPVSVGEIPDD